MRMIAISHRPHLCLLVCRYMFSHTPLAVGCYRRFSQKTAETDNIAFRIEIKVKTKEC